MRRRALLLTMALLAGACGDDDPVAPTEPETGESTTVSTEVIPNPASAAPATAPAYAWTTSFRVRLVESAGTGASVVSVAAQLEQTESGVVVEPPEGEVEDYRFDLRPGSNRLEGNGSLELPMVFEYVLPNGGREALVTLVVTLFDDAGRFSTVTAEVPIQ